MNPLLKLTEHGQSYWLDNLTRKALRTGDLARRVRNDGLRGVTSNPTTFSDSVLGDALYAEELAALAEQGRTTEEIYETLAVSDVREGCDVLRPVYDATEGRDGFVSLEVSPKLAHDTEASVAEAQRLARAVARPNLMIKIPGTKAGVAAVEQVLYEGIHVNVTLLFSVQRYAEFAEAYVRALERRQRDGKSVHDVRSVASFFLSRIDVLVDRLLAQHERPGNAARASESRSLRGKAAIANAKLAFRHFREQTAGARWQALERAGAEPQRLLWASTGTKNPSYRDVMYVEPLIGRPTVSTMPETTITAFADHGIVADTLESGMDEAASVLRALGELGIDFGCVASELENEGIQKFLEPQAKLVEHLERERSRAYAKTRLGTLRDTANNLRREIVSMTHAAGSGHPTSSLSCADLVTALFFHQMRWNPTDPRTRNADSFVLSKGHAAPVLWAALSEAGALDESPLTLRKFGSTIEGHPTPRNPWVRMATGSLGQGLTFANGMALANRADGIDARVYCLMGDGECSEGSVWEAAQFAALNRLTNLVVLVDVNALGQSGLAPYKGDVNVLAERFRAFGWKAQTLDGHDMAAILDALHAAEHGGPTALIARTVKGKGVSFLEAEPGWHGKAMNDELTERAIEELGPPRPKLAVTPRRVGAVQPIERAAERERITVEYAPEQHVATRTGFGKALAKLGAVYPELVVLDGDVRDSTREEYFASKFPDRFIECYIAEQNMAGVALGLAKSGKIPVVATFACFLTRAADFIRMAAYSRPEHLVFCGSHAGISIGEDGPSQMGIEDLALFRAVLGSTVLYPSDAVSAERLTEQALKTPGIVYLRTTRPDTPILYRSDEQFPVGGSKQLRHSAHDRLTIVAAGITAHEALAAHAVLAQQGVAARVIDAYSVKPLDAETIRRAARETGRVLVVEDHVAEGGLGEAVAAVVNGLAPVRRLAVTSTPRSGTMAELLDAYGISRNAIVEAADELLSGHEHVERSEPPPPEPPRLPPEQAAKVTHS